MSTTDGQGSSAAPFSGDESGSIFNNPDVVSESPTTSERVVDTQSGFLLIVRRAQERLALSLKRRLGTPPTSSILLTPDESVQLSRILADAWRPAKTSTLSNDAENLVSNMSKGNLRGIARGDYGSKVSQGMRPIVLVMVVLALFNFAAGSFAGYFAHTSTPAKPVITGMSSDVLNLFSRQFVANLLDFNPKTYKMSQIRAMAHMAPELMNSYWTDTGFPLSKDQLDGSSKLEITKLDCQKLDAQNAIVDVKGEMISGKGAKATPVHLMLKLTMDSDNQILVVEQNDLAASDDSENAPAETAKQDGNAEANSQAVN